MQNIACPPDPSGSDSTGLITVQPSLHSALGLSFLPGLVRPQVDENFIDQTVGSNARWKQFMVITRHRELWNSFCGSALIELRAEYQRLKYRVILTWFQSVGCQGAYYMTPSNSWFVKWPSWAVLLLSLAMFAGTWLMIANVVGVYKLLQNSPGLADSPVSCAIVATIAGGCVFATKFGVGSLEGSPSKKHYFVASVILTGILAVAFFVLLALLTGGLAATTVPVDSVGGNLPVIGRPWLSPHLQWVQLILEWYASLTLFLSIDVLTERYGMPNSEQNPRKVYRYRQWKAAEESLRDDRQSCGRARGNVFQLISERKAFVASALGSFERKSELARRQEEGLRRQRGESAATPPPGLLSRIRRFFTSIKKP